MSSENAVDRLVNIGKNWVRIWQQGSPSLIKLPASIRNGADLARIDKLRSEMESEYRRDAASAAKYADYRYWIPFNIPRVGSLSLHNSKPLRILDIGCGPGYFLAGARACGHDVYGVDAPPEVMSKTEQRVYSELLAAMQLTSRVSPMLVERFVPMSVAHRDLDLITAFWICFNCHRRPDEWSATEWRFFIDDALSHLREGGVLHLELNSHPERYQSLQWYDADTLGFFRSVGTVNGNTVRIRKK